MIKITANCPCYDGLLFFAGTPVYFTNHCNPQCPALFITNNRKQYWIQMKICNIHKNMHYCEWSHSVILSLFLFFLIRPKPQFISQRFFCFVLFVSVYVFKNFTQWFWGISRLKERSKKNQTILWHKMNTPKDNINTEKSRYEACVCLAYGTLSSTLKI